jgi:hypothetical protein
MAIRWNMAKRFLASARTGRNNSLQAKCSEKS